MTEIGIKHDTGKPNTHITFSGFGRALLEVAKIGTFGIAKYGPYNWKSVANGYERYSSAMLRHYLLEGSEGTDPETGYLHAAHVAWNALARLELAIQERDEKE